MKWHPLALSERRKAHSRKALYYILSLHCAIVQFVVHVYTYVLHGCATGLSTGLPVDITGTKCEQGTCANESQIIEYVYSNDTTL